jgi:hypothetical protein
MDEKWFTNRDYIGERWSRKAIRTVQAVLNSTKGKIGKGREFFFKAFGRNEAEFLELIQMPEAFIIKRWDAELCGLTGKWRTAYRNLTEDERTFVDGLVAPNIFNPSDWANQSKAVKVVLNLHHLNKRHNIPHVDEAIKRTHIQTFGKTCPMGISEECRRLLHG